jgi:DNA-binding beta-propeller fold protein YncE
MERIQSRRQFFQSCSLRFGAVALAGTRLGETLALGQTPAQPSVGGAASGTSKPLAKVEQPLPESHTLDEAWPTPAQIPYADRVQYTGVAVAKDGSILALNHGENHSDPALGYLRKLIQKPAVLVLDPKTGKVLRSWGSNMFMLPHHISVDLAGNIWIVDGALKNVFKFDANGSKLLEIKGKECDLQMPSDVAVLKDGSFIVADGSLTRRGVLFDVNGVPQGDWGRRGEEPAQFHTPHALAVDESDTVYVADRENHWIQVLNAAGEWKATWSKVGRPACVRFHSGSVWVLCNFDANKGIVRRFSPAGELLEAFHTRPAKTQGDYEWPHGLAVTDGGNTVYVGFILTSRQILRYRRKAR